MLHRDKYCTLIVFSPKFSLATYFDSGSLEMKKNYTRIRGVLDEAVEGYAKKGCPFANKGENFNDGKHVFEFPCIKQSAGNVNEAFYVLHHIKGYVWGFLECNTTI
jgi:hypothetical protein